MKQLNWRRGLWRIWIIGTVVWAVWKLWKSEFELECLIDPWCFEHEGYYFRLLVTMLGPPVLTGILVRWVIAGFEKQPLEAEPDRRRWFLWLYDWGQWLVLGPPIAIILIAALVVGFVALFIMDPSWVTLGLLIIPISILGPLAWYWLREKYFED
jgi:hypothetical protein